MRISPRSAYSIAVDGPTDINVSEQRSPACCIDLEQARSAQCRNANTARMPTSVRLICSQGQIITTQERAAQLPALAEFLAEEGEAPVITVPHSRAVVSAALSDDSMEHLKDLDLFDVLVVRELGHCCQCAHGLGPDLPELGGIAAVLMHTAPGVTFILECAQSECARACCQKQLSSMRSVHSAHVCTRSACNCPPVSISQSRCRTSTRSHAHESCIVCLQHHEHVHFVCSWLTCTSKTHTYAKFFHPHAQTLIQPRCHKYNHAWRMQIAHTYRGEGVLARAAAALCERMPVWQLPQLASGADVPAATRKRTRPTAGDSVAERFQALHHDVVEAATQARLAALYPPPQPAASKLPEKLAALPAAMHAMACALESRPPRVVVLSLAHTHAERVVAMMPAAGAHVKVTDFDLQQERAYLLLRLRGLQALDVRGCDLRTCGAVFAQVLGMLTSLHSLDLQGIQVVSDEAMGAIARALGSLTRLTQLQLRDWGADGCGINSDGVFEADRVTSFGAALAPALSQLTRLLRVSLADDVMWMCDAVVLVPALRLLTALVDLDLGRNGVGDESMVLMEPMLHGLGGLTRLVLCYDHLSEAGALPLVSGLQALTGLVDLRLFGVGMWAEAVTMLAEALHRRSHLQRLQLQGLDIDEVSEAALAASLSGLTALTCLQLQGMQQGGGGQAELLSALRGHERLTRLQFSFDASAADPPTAVAAMLRCHRGLTRLDLSSGDIGSVTALAHALRDLSSLRWLDLHNTSLNDSDSSVLLPALRTLMALTWLDLMRNGFSDAGAAAIRHHLSELTALRIRV